MCGTRLALVCPDCASVSPPNYRFCGVCGRVLVEGAARGQPPTDIAPLEVARTLPAESPMQAPTLLPAQTEPAVAEPAVRPRPSKEVRLDGERRMATVILADVQGSTNLMEEIGTEAWVSMMNRVFHILESEIYRYGGTVDQFRGDGLVAFFGTAAVHEDDPERAVLASLAMQDAIRAYAAELAEKQGIGLRLRVGVNTGEVIVANIGDRTQHSEDTAMGEAIALAARMETAAEPGTVLVSENTYHHIESRFEWKSLGEITVKGISQPVAVYRPLAPRSETRRAPRLEAYGLSSLLVGRDREFESMLRRVSDLRAGTGCVVLLTGDEGMGKSYLVSQVHQQALKDEALLTKARGAQGVVPKLSWLRGHCRSYEQSWPYSMWLDMLRRWLGAYGETREGTRERLWQESGMLWGGQADQYFPYLAALLSLPLESEAAGRIEGLDAESLRQQFFVTLRSWVEAMIQRGPVVLVFDDVYWADVTSLDLLEYCLPLCEHGPLMLLLMFRLQPGSTVWEFHRRVEAQYPHRLLALTLAPLTEAQSGAMIDQIVGPKAFPQETRAQIIERAEGNPYYIEEIIRALIRDGALVVDEKSGQWRAVRAIESLGLPGTLRNLLLARMNDLSPVQRRVLQMAAVIGSVFWTDVLQELVGAEEALDEHLAALQRAQFVRQRGRIPDLGIEYAFQSALLRDIACESVLSAQRVVYSRQVADYLAGLFGKEVLAQFYGVVAYQYRCAQEPRRELFYTLSAAEHAQGIYANAEALEYYTRALELLDELEAADLDSGSGLWQDWRLESLVGLGRVCLGMGKTEEAETYLRRAVALSEEVDSPVKERVRLYYWLCEALFWQGQHEEQLRLAEQGLALLGDDTESVEAALMNQELAVGHRARGEIAEFAEHTARTAQFLHRLPYSEELRPAYDHIVSMYVYEGKDADEAMRWLQIMEEQATSHHDLRALGEAHGHAANILMHTGDLRGAVPRYRESLKDYEQIGDARHGYDALINVADVLFALGELDEASQCIDRMLQMGEAPSAMGHGWAHLYRGRVLAARGEWVEATRAIEEAVASFQETEMPFLFATAQYHLARVHLFRGNAEDAWRILEEISAYVELDALEQSPLVLASALTAMERAAQSQAAFRAFCRERRERLPGTPLVQWYLEPTERDAEGYALLYDDRFADSLPPGWTWQDPLDDCVLRVQDGLQIHAANGRDLWHLNLSAPRVVRPVTGEWAAEVACRAVTASKPAMGGLLLWKDKKNYLRLDHGSGGQQCVMFLGCLNNQDMAIGRGLLSGGGERVFLRLEQTSDVVRALVSPDGTEWFTVGEARIQMESATQVGLYGSGVIDRLSYPGAHRDGTATGFSSFRLWRALPGE
jgi:class 3 adenylate cyclase/tetratricopeptide (TPR) repeat protein